MESFQYTHEQVFNRCNVVIDNTLYRDAMVNCSAETGYFNIASRDGVWLIKTDLLTLIKMVSEGAIADHETQRDPDPEVAVMLDSIIKLHENTLHQIRNNQSQHEQALASLCESEKQQLYCIDHWKSQVPADLLKEWPVDEILKREG
jgi:hypothetical protein